MTHPFPISFHLTGNTESVFPGSPCWDLLLPGNQFAGNSRESVSPAYSAEKNHHTISIGDYFTAARTFLTGPGSQYLFRAVEVLAGTGGRIDRVRISLEKHGAFYHPLRVAVRTEDNAVCSLVLNGAVSEPGLTLIETEHRLLSDLAQMADPSHIPRVFGFGSVSRAVAHAAFFLGEWFDGFFEFHATEAAGKRRVAVWGPGEEIRLLTFEDAAPAYENIAGILTTYYNVRTGEGIFPWHLAAGDFIVYPAFSGLPVRLISVRGYQPLAAADAGSAQEALWLPSLLFFFLSLTLRIRLDRLDGTGDTVFLDETVLEAAVSGFFKALSHKEESLENSRRGVEPLPRGSMAVFRDFASGFEHELLLAISTSLIEAWNPGASELAVLRAHLGAHCKAVCSILK